MKANKTTTRKSLTVFFLDNYWLWSSPSNQASLPRPLVIFKIITALHNLRHILCKDTSKYNFSVLTLTVDQKLLFNLSFLTKLRVKKSLPIVNEFAVESISHQNLEANERERREFLAVSKAANSHSQSKHYGT